MAPHRPIARNYAVSSENKIHSDAIAKRLGFTGALVPGVTVFGHLCFPLTQRYGESWLKSSFVTTRFLKPAYHGERLTIVATGADREESNGVSVECKNDSGVLLATLECRRNEQSSIDRRSLERNAKPGSDRVEINWESVHVGEPFASYAWTPDAAHNAEYSSRVDDETEIYKRGVIHPHAILSQANQALVKHFVMPAWIHTGSEIRFRNVLRVGDAVEVRAVPIDKWEKKGHQFIKLHIAFARGDEIVTEIEHTAIFRVAGSE